MFYFVKKKIASVFFNNHTYWLFRKRKRSIKINKKDDKMKKYKNTKCAKYLFNLFKKNQNLKNIKLNCHK